MSTVDHEYEEYEEDEMISTPQDKSGVNSERSQSDEWTGRFSSTHIHEKATESRSRRRSENYDKDETGCGGEEEKVCNIINEYK